MIRAFITRAVASPCNRCRWVGRPGYPDECSRWCLRIFVYRQFMGMPVWLPEDEPVEEWLAHNERPKAGADCGAPGG